ncbi:flagellar biosynthesis/type III secretory pathway protein [Sulfurihydrogenibium sp.]|uniref:flagellar biosynthesis/type III secretory pathway protein n=1 Tax=Sulfurihydrogenibium sp. TaxID=2053621 RepID=UPI00260DA9CB|nr:flagellar biosynthesis/type III secretory pathway protein [Sulfurihydrogenibium sp.]
MPYRMLEYYIMLKRRYKDRQIIQIVLYIGNGKPRMKNTIKENNIQYTYVLKDIKEIECKELMESQNIEDKILAVLCKVEDFEKYILNLVDYLMRLPEKERGDYIRKLLIALDYRPKLKERLSLMMEERKMPLTITQEMIKQDPFYKKGLEKGLEKGIKQGLEKGIKQGLEKGIKQGKIISMQNSIIIILEEKFGNIPKSLEDKIKSINEEEILTNLMKMVLNAKSIEDIKI